MFTKRKRRLQYSLEHTRIEINYEFKYQMKKYAFSIMLNHYT